MGDRTYVSFAINGHIATVEALDALCEAMAHEGVKHEGCGYGSEADEFKFSVGPTIMAGETTILVEDEECNYANLDVLEQTCREHNIAYHFEWEAGCDYPAGQKSFLPEHGVMSSGFDSDGALVPLGDLQKALQADDALTALREIIDSAAMAGGHRQPNLSASQEVKDHLAGWLESND